MYPSELHKDISLSYGAVAQKRAMASFSPKDSRSHTTTHHSRLESSGSVISSSQRSLPDNTHKRQNYLPSVELEPLNLIKQAAADPRLIPRGDSDRP